MKRSIQSIILVIFASGIIGVHYSWAEQAVVFAIGEWAPFVGEKMENAGPTAEIISLACKKTGLKPDYQYMPWSRAYLMVKNGTAVGTFPWSCNAERAAEIFCPETPIMVSKDYVYYLKDAFPNGIMATKLEDLKPYKLVGILSYWYDKPAKEMGLDMHLVSNGESALKMIHAGRKDAYIENELVAPHEIKMVFPDDFNKFTHSSEPIRTSDMFVLFSRVHPDAPDVMKKIDKALKELTASGEIERILKK
ncbi:MAG: transporter substrate-binding domain-containing protein [Proteobacteria bacterium]|nr:transporter substrate-binding domain-containing protein [Pseudomonadota bacterium]